MKKRGAYNKKVIFDEAQKAPELFNRLKIVIDENRDDYGRFVLTGSSQFSLVRGISETLAGRIGMLSLLPFQMREIPKGLRGNQLVFGSYPELVTRKYEGSEQWYGSYISNYLERDVRSLVNIGNLRDFRRLLMLLASRVSQELNMSSLAGDVGVSVKTVQSWISILEASYVVFLLPPYYNNLGKRVVKRPKLYFWDTGVVCYLTGINETEVLHKGPLAGPVFENFIISEIFKNALHNDDNQKFFYFRDNHGLEVDLIIENLREKKVRVVEIKNTHTARPVMAEQVQYIQNLMLKNNAGDIETFGYFIYRGKSGPVFHEGVQVINYIDYLFSH